MRHSISGRPIEPPAPTVDPRHHQIREMLEAGYSQRAIAVALGLSAPRVSQLVGRSPELRRIRTATSRSHRELLQSYRSELLQVATELRGLTLQVRRSIRALNEELDSVMTDTILGLRP